MAEFAGINYLGSTLILYQNAPYADKDEQFAIAYDMYAAFKILN